MQAAGVKCFDNHPNMKYVTVSDIAGHILYWELYLRIYWQYTSKTCTFISNMLKRDNPEGKSILEWELNPLDRIHDHNPKYLLNMDFTPLTSHNGIRQMNALE